MRGRYVAWSPEVAAQVIELVAQGRSLAGIGRMEGMPSFTTLIRWRHESSEFQDAYLEACSRRPPGYLARGPYGTKAQIAARRAARGCKRGSGRAAGRPSVYDPDLADQVCKRIADGESMLALTLDRTLPSGQSLYNWLEEEDEFRRKYNVACEIRGEVLAEEMLAIADDASGDFIPGKDGLVANLQAIRRAKLMMDARKWQATKLAPRKYGLRPKDDPHEKMMSWEDALMELE